jgi:diguanylate cyclase (GGDEF)-like protein
LTAIANRRTFDSTLAREVARAARSGEAVSLVVLDIDHFKRLNDEHGHQVGDEVLRQVAGVLAGHARGFDTVARYGGEEFAVILPGCETHESLIIAERLREATCESSTVVPVTVSAGVATFPMHAIDAPSLLGAADEALYESKRAGRNRVTASGKSDSLTAAPPALPAPNGDLHPADPVPANTLS